MALWPSSSTNLSRYLIAGMIDMIVRGATRLP